MLCISWCTKFCGLMIATKTTKIGIWPIKMNPHIFLHWSHFLSFSTNKVKKFRYLRYISSNYVIRLLFTYCLCLQFHCLLIDICLLFVHFVFRKLLFGFGDLCFFNISITIMNWYYMLNKSLKSNSHFIYCNSQKNTPK